jgi:magnesium transporter
VVDREDHLKGRAAAQEAPGERPDVEVAALYERAAVALAADTDAEEAAQAFERYDLVSAPVVDAQGRVIARLTVDAVLDYVRESQEEQELGKVGLREEEDIFSSVWASAKNRGPWLALNLCTAFIASRVIGAFEGLDRQARRARGAHADRRRDRRQLRQPDHDAHRPRHRPRAGEPDQRAPAALRRSSPSRR